MIGIVIVSHSLALANALVDLVQQVSNQPLSLAVAAGAGPGGKEFGTNAIEIAEAIQSVYSPEGVLVLMDLGSAILSAEMALNWCLKRFARKSVSVQRRWWKGPFLLGCRQVWEAISKLLAVRRARH